MNEKEEKKYETIEKVVNGILTRSEAEEKIGLSKRQVNRLIQTYKKEGKEGFIPKMNTKFAIPIDKKKTLMRENKYTVEDLALIISERYSRTIDSGSCVKYNNKYYIPTDKDNKEVYFKNKTPVIVIIDYNYKLRCLIEQKYYKLKEIKKQEYNPALVAQEIEDSWNKEREKYIPPGNPPWRNFKI